MDWNAYWQETFVLWIILGAIVLRPFVLALIFAFRDTMKSTKKH